MKYLKEEEVCVWRGGWGVEWTGGRGGNAEKRTNNRRSHDLWTLSFSPD